MKETGKVSGELLGLMRRLDKQGGDCPFAITARQILSDPTLTMDELIERIRWIENDLRVLEYLDALVDSK